MAFLEGSKCVFEFDMRKWQPQMKSKLHSIHVFPQTGVTDTWYNLLNTHRCILHPGWSAHSSSGWTSAEKNNNHLNLKVKHCLSVCSLVTYRLESRQHAHISCKVGGFEDGLVISPEVQVHHQRLELLTNGPWLVFHIPAVRSRVYVPWAQSQWSGRHFWCDVLTP